MVSPPRYAASMLQFHAIIHGEDGGRPGPLTVSFESATMALATLPRLFIEPDGSFIWSQFDADGTAWQVEGNLMDQGPSLAHVEMNGHCPETAFNELLAAFGWPGEKLLFQLPRQGVVLDEDAFRRSASSVLDGF